MGEELKCCPFCGGNELELFEGVVMFTALINCGKCKIQVQLLCIERDEKELAKAWNRRDGEGKIYDLEVQDGWVNMKNRLPDDGEQVLICTNKRTGDINIVFATFRMKDGYNLPDFWVHGSLSYIIFDVTHWMPLPPPPSK